MPAQQSASAETDEEDKTLEVPRQSVLSGLQDSAISNFENDSVAEATNERPQKRKDYRRKASKAAEHPNPKEVQPTNLFSTNMQKQIKLITERQGTNNKRKRSIEKQEAALVYQSYDSAAEHSGGLSNGEFDTKNALTLN